MSDVDIVIGVRGDISGGRQVKANLDDITASGNKAIGTAESLKKTLAGVSSAANVLKGALGGMIGAFGIMELIKTADQYTLLEARLKSIAKTGTETTRMMNELRRVANETGGEIETSLGILQRLSFVRDEIKATNNEMLSFTETVTKLGVISGAGPEAMKAGLTQLGQALSNSIVRAEEFNSIMENIPGVGKAIADQFGVTTGQLRQLVINGKVLSSDVFAAILNQAQKVNAEFAEFPKTATQGLDQMLNSFDLIVAQANKASGATNAIGSTFREVGELSKVMYDGIATFFDYEFAGIQEMINAALIGFNKIIEAVNWLKQNSPEWAGLDKTPYALKPTLEVGSVFAEANAARKQREAGLFSDPFAKELSTGTRAISQDYAAIASKLGESKESAKELKKIQSDLKKVVEDTYTNQEKYNAKVAELEKLRPFAKTTQEAEAINRAIKAAGVELEKLRVQAEVNGPTARAFQSLANSIDDGMKESFEKAFAKSDGGFKRLLAGMKATFLTFLADLAYIALARPIVLDVVAGLGGGMGLSSGAVNSILGPLGGGTASGGAGSSMFSGGTSLLSMGKSLFGGGISTGIGNATSSIASKAYGLFSNDSYGALAFGDRAGDFMANAGSFGNVAGGALGGISASMLGLANKNMYVNAALSTIGGIAGSAFGPVGSFAGSFLGSTIGGFFGGGKPSDKAQGGVLDYSSLAMSVSGQTGKKYSAENASFRDQILNTLKSVIGTVQQYGGSVSGSANIVVGSRDGLRYNGQNFGNNSTAFTNAIFGDLKNSITGLNSTFQTILDKVGTQNPDTLSSAFAFGQQYLDTLNPKTVAMQLSDAIKVLNDNMTAAIQSATNLGLPIDEYTKALQKQKDAAVGALKAQLAGFSTLEEMTKTFNDFLNGQALGSSSSLSPTDKLNLAQNNFGDLLSKAQGGDMGVTQELLKAANQLLDVGRGVYASSVSFAGLESFVRSSISEIAKAAGVPGFATGADSAFGGMAMVGEQGRELVQLGGGERIHSAGDTAGIMAMSGNIATDVVRTNAQRIAQGAETLDEIRLARKEAARTRAAIEKLHGLVRASK